MTNRILNDIPDSFSPLVSAVVSERVSVFVVVFIADVVGRVDNIMTIMVRMLYLVDMRLNGYHTGLVDSNGDLQGVLDGDLVRPSAILCCELLIK